MERVAATDPDEVVTDVDIDGVGPVTVGFAELPDGVQSAWRQDWRILILNRGLSPVERISAMGQWAFELKDGVTVRMHSALGLALALSGALPA